MRENIVIGVSADVSMYESQMERLTRETDRSWSEAARRVESLAGDMTGAHEEMYSAVRDLAGETAAYQVEQTCGWQRAWEAAAAEGMRLSREAAEAHVDAEAEKSRAAEGFFDGVRRGYDDLRNRLVDWADAGERVFQTFVGQSAAFFENGLFAVIKGRFDDLGDAWQSLVDSMLRSFLSFIAEMAAQNLAQAMLGGLGAILPGGGLLGGLAGLFGGGGFSGIISAGAGLISGALEAVGGLLGGLFDPVRPETERIFRPVEAAAVRAEPERRESSRGGHGGAGRSSRVEIHIHGDTLADPATLERVALQVGEAWERQRRFVFTAF